ncbi:hypothetical protein CAPTEDRAFT_147210 [Capitella teleta]|uniref:Solute carrier family 25 member 44 n=1 Tax=Capitella teleta TaxID=283909 RepID=R7VM02_CAPTE|nr:hypothetical protein CAPTEDRAFT_147210 [Capitella teleta]|eukprot:ELU18696.1 hypothetical protein CAPTEDRAFT_147210 [Capitella teleta]
MEYDMATVPVVEFHMLNLKKYVPLTALSGFCVRGILYPFTLIKTRLQVQRNNSMYTGTYDAFSKIIKGEGAAGLYRGFWLSNLMVFSQISYITTYEGVRHYLKENTPFTNTYWRSLIGGACASLVGQTFMVPIDVISQHLQMLGLQEAGASVAGRNLLTLPPGAARTRFGATNAIISAVYRRDGIRGFYHGYGASLMVYVPNSACWWLLYDFYNRQLAAISPVWVPRLALQVMAGPMSGITITCITTPLDAIRARVQVENLPYGYVARSLWKEEGMWIFTKGLSARLVSSISFSFFIILGYETVKRWSLKEEYKHMVRW